MKSIAQRNKVLFYILMILAIFLTGCKDKQEEKKQEIAKQTLEKLKTDYNEEFEIESISYVRENDSYILFVHPKAEPDMSFRVVRWKMAGNKLIDDYIPLRRALQTRKLFKPFADSISTKNLLHANITVVEQNKTIASLKDQKEYWDLNYPIKDFIDMYNENTQVMVDIFYFFNLNENNTEDVCKKVYEMIKYIQDLNVGEVNISIQFYDEKFFKDKDVVKINEEEMGPAGMMNFQSTYSTKYNTANIVFREKTLQEFKKIKSYKDIEKNIWYKKFTGEKSNIGEDMYIWIQK